MFSRPGAKDTESDLLRFQQEFLAGHVNPSAAVVRSSTEEESRSAFAGEKRVSPFGNQVERDVVTLEGLSAMQTSSLSDPGLPPKKKSRFKTRHQKKKSERDDKEDIDCAELLDIHDRHVTSVLCQIKEREIQYGSVRAPEVSESGFPVALHRGNINEQKAFSSKGTNSEGRKSLFAQQFLASGGVSFGVKEHKTNNLQLKTESSKAVKMDSKTTTQFPRSFLLSGKGLVQSGGEETLFNREVEEIHSENVAKLESMTEEEIIEEQARIKSSLDPSLIAFLTSRQKKSKNETTDSDTGVEERKEDGCHGDNTSCNMEVESGPAEKHVQFSEDVEIIKQEDKEKTISKEQSDGCITIGDLQVSNKWLHMDTVETEKLEWIKGCPAPSALESKQGNQVRFDFDGHLVSKSDHIPEYLGLHHHGDDPSSAGYTLDELFVLARSSFLQQRVFALQVLARIMRQDQLGAFQEHLNDNVVSVLLDAGVLFLLRWALDDTSDAILAAAVQGLASILIVPSDKELADKLFSFPRGHELPALCLVTGKEQKSSSDDEEEVKGITDAELLKQDAIKGLIQMSILPRLRYILEVCCPAAPTVHDILDILMRISRHSTQAANEVLKCPRLMEAIFANFLPLSWKLSEIKSGEVYGQPVSTAMRLVRAVCCTGRHMAAALISKYNLLDRLMRYTALTAHNMQVELQEAYSLYIESLRTWRVCVLYGLGCDALREMYSAFIEHLQSIQSLSILAAKPEETSELSCAKAIFGIIEAAIHAAGAAADQKAQENVSTPDEHHRMDSLPPLALNWSHVTGFLPLIGGCVTKWVKEIVDSNTTVLQPENLCLLSGAIAALTAFYSQLDMASHSPVDTLQQLEQLTSTVLLPFVDSKFLDCCFTRISVSCNSRNSKMSRKTIPSLPGYGSLELSWRLGTQYTKSNISELIGFISSLLQLMYQVTKLHKGMAAKYSAVLHKEAILKYLMLAVEAMDAPLSFFSRQEHHLQYFLLKLANNVFEMTESDDIFSCIPLWHEVALSLFAKIFPGDEFYAFDLLSTVLFNSKFFRVPRNEPSSSDVTRDLSEMSLTTPPQPSTYDTATASRGGLIAQAHNNLPCIRSMFVGSFQGMKRALDVSRSLSLHQVRHIQSFLVSPCTGPIQPADWMFLPIVDLHNQAISLEMKGKGIDTITGPAVSIVTATLQLVLMLEDWRPSCLRHVSMTSRIARLICVFLTGNDLFLNNKVHDYLSALLRIYTNSSQLGKLDFNSPIPGLTSFYDLYASLLSQYSAVSFGDLLFSCFVILPLTQRHDIKFRRAVWDEHIGVLRALSIPIDQLPIPLEEFLYPVEQSQSLLALYLRTLATQTVRPLWSPLLYLVAVHHVNSFVFQRIDPKDEPGLKKKITLLKQIFAVQNENVRHDVLHYYKPATSNPAQPFEKFTNLPADRQLLLRNRESLEDCRQIYQTMNSA